MSQQPGSASGRANGVLVVMQVSKKNIGAAAGSALSSGKDSVMDVLVMENVLYAANTTRIYDLKGSERSRWSQEDPTQAGAVLMDDNLRENNLTQPILVRPMLPCLSAACMLAQRARGQVSMLQQHVHHMCMSTPV